MRGAAQPGPEDSPGQAAQHASAPKVETMILTTQRLILHEMTSDDLDDMAALLGDADVMCHYPKPASRDEARAWIEWNQRLYRDHGFGLWVVVVHETGEFAGDCGLTIQHVDGADEVDRAHR
jgi:RimJ/RimL family protein N-acetyltransferase